jgi:pimeloyl-ACP methyl ester carboxylesterase
MADEVVFLITGYGAPPSLFFPVRRYLNAQGFRAESWPYDSFSESVAIHGARLAADVRNRDADPGVARIHLVGHSMGAVIVRAALSEYVPKKLGRVVLAAPPNHGARLADWALAVGRRHSAARDLSSRPDSYVNQLAGLDDIEFGVLAARFDHVVAHASTHLAGERDHLTLMAPHTVILHPAAGKQIAHFLRHGRFYRPHEPPRKGSKPT